MSIPDELYNGELGELLLGQRPSIWRFFLVVAFAAILFALLFMSIGAVLSGPITMATNPAFRLVSIPTLVILGLALYKFKQASQLTYGIAETAFAMASAYMAFSKVRPEDGDVAAAMTVVGTVYLISRGVANIAEGWAKRAAKLAGE